MNKILFSHDDPYVLLAWKIITSQRPADTIRVLFDDEFLRRKIVHEVRTQDFRGPFLDCLIERLVLEKKRMEFMRQLDALADFFYEKLDKERLRDNIVEALKEIGYDVSEFQSTAGKVSSLTT